MSTPKRKVKIKDPATAANEAILADIARRNEQKANEKALADDIGLNPKPQASTATNAAEFLAEEWDKKAFGNPETYSRVVYGPDPLLDKCPEAKLRIEQIGLEAYAQSTAEAIRLKRDKAVPDPIMQRALANGIERFGLESVVNAFLERIMKIPQRTIYVETDGEDPLLLSRPLEEAVERYGSPGMAPKFLSERCIDRFGLRGYQIVLKENGDPVKVGTLIMGEIPIHVAERRQRHYAQMSDEQLRQIEGGFNDVAERAIGNTKGFATL